MIQRLHQVCVIDFLEFLLLFLLLKQARRAEFLGFGLWSMFCLQSRFLALSKWIDMGERDEMSGLKRLHGSSYTRGSNARIHEFVFAKAG